MAASDPAIQKLAKNPKAETIVRKAGSQEAGRLLKNSEYRM